MPHKKIVSDAINSYQETLNQAINIAHTLTLEPFFELPFNTSTISAAWAKSALHNLRTGYKLADKGKCVLYVFKLDNNQQSEIVLREIKRAKGEQGTNKKKKNLCTLNRQFEGSETLYVGRSFTPRSRIGQHLISSSSGTYAMHLEEWAKPLALNVRLTVYDVPQYNDQVEVERAMNVLETGVWDHLRPLLGRRGDR
ncbi:hypothetical protein [Achromobacter xylosoxidans]|uniref:hypothetical protein n=1 Tax=Alcaligenes xylosoxydans xylosoxydans TaxID=85698 RepID=UPI00129370ED|nr:hypothetical protein [Achromobacter xylosoxidans]